MYNRPKTDWDFEAEQILKELEQEGDGNFSNCDINSEDLDISLSDLEMEYE
jgi:hypothetical protein